MTTFMTNPSDLDLRLEPLLDGAGDRAVDRAGDRIEPGATTVANPRRTTWTGYAKNAEDRMPSY